MPSSITWSQPTWRTTRSMASEARATRVDSIASIGDKVSDEPGVCAVIAPTETSGGAAFTSRHRRAAVASLLMSTT